MSRHEEGRNLPSGEGVQLPRVSQPGGVRTILGGLARLMSPEEVGVVGVVGTATEVTVAMRAVRRMERFTVAVRVE